MRLHLQVWEILQQLSHTCVGNAHPKMVYCMSRWGAGPSRIEKEDPPELGSECRPMERMPLLSCLTSGNTSRGTVLSPSSCMLTA